jgi:hypothetical protein
MVGGEAARDASHRELRTLGYTGLSATLAFRSS